MTMLTYMYFLKPGNLLLFYFNVVNMSVILPYHGNDNLQIIYVVLINKNYAVNKKYINWLKKYIIALFVNKVLDKNMLL